jgi:ATP-dependent DNA ligase
MQARIDGRVIRLLTRKKLDWTERFRSIADPLKALGLGSALIDGEIVVEDASGISSFNDLQADLKTGRLDRFRYFVFDILYCEGFDLTKVVLKDRKNLLQQLLAILPPGSPIRAPLCEHNACAQTTSTALSFPTRRVFLARLGSYNVEDNPQRKRRTGRPLSENR